MSNIDLFKKELIDLMEKYSVTLTISSQCARPKSGQDPCEFIETWYELDEDNSKLWRFGDKSLSMKDIYYEKKNPI